MRAAYSLMSSKKRIRMDEKLPITAPLRPVKLTIIQIIGMDTARNEVRARNGFLNSHDGDELV